MNPSFEDTVSCPIGPDEVFKCAEWTSYSASPDYMNYCSTSMSVPFNWGGYQQAASGNAYCAFATYVSMLSNYREFIGGNLSTPLAIGIKYFVSFKIALSINWAAAGNCASNKMGVMFSTVPYTVFNPSPITNNPPVYTETIVTDTVNWTTIFGSFIADSAYNQVIVGNFFDDSFTDTIKFTTGFFDAAYYYLDDVCVSTDSAYAHNYTGIENLFQNSFLSCFPNPFHSKLNFQSQHNELTELFLLDITSRKLLHQSFTNSISIDTEQFADGIYIYELRNNKGTIKTGKVIRQ